MIQDMRAAIGRSVGVLVLVLTLGRVQVNLTGKSSGSGPSGDTVAITAAAPTDSPKPDARPPGTTKPPGDRR